MLITTSPSQAALAKLYLEAYLLSIPEKRQIANIVMLISQEVKCFPGSL
jgi:hypothetical protein